MVSSFVVVKRLSNVTYQVQDCSNQRKIVVHFNRLKLYRVQTTVKVKAKDKLPQDNTEPRPHFGAELELVGDECEGDVVLTYRENSPQDSGADSEPNVQQEDSHQEPELVRRYPRRVHHPPEYYS